MESIKEVMMIVNNRISKDFIYFMSLVFVLVLGFMIGRTSEIKNNKSDVKVYDISSGLEILPNPTSSLFEEHSMGDDKEFSNSDTNLDVNSLNSSTSRQNINKSKVFGDKISGGKIFGSRKGKYFYYEGCGGSTISPKNLVYYKTESNAIAKGKVLYGKCR